MVGMSGGMAGWQLSWYVGGGGGRGKVSMDVWESLGCDNGSKE
jgi:hypothetical protein